MPCLGENSTTEPFRTRHLTFFSWDLDDDVPGDTDGLREPEKVKKKVFAVNAVMAAGILILAIFWGVMLIERGIAAFLSLAGFTQFQFFPLPLDKKQRTSCVWILETPTNRLVTLGSAIPHPGCLIPGYELTQPCETAF